MASLVCLPLCFVFRCRSRFYISLFVNISRHSIIIVVVGYCFFSFFVRVFRMRLLNSIHDEIGNRSLAWWFCLDFSLEIAVQTNRSKACTRVIVGKRFAVCSGAKNIPVPGMHIAS